MSRLLAGVSVIPIMAIVACGGSGDGDEFTDPGQPVPTVSESGFDESVLPDDFPRQLIPTDYSSGAYLNLSGVPSTASFESNTPVDETVDHYTALLGEPVLATEGDASQRSAQWQDSGWLVSVVGSPDESIIGITKVER